MCYKVIVNFSKCDTDFTVIYFTSVVFESPTTGNVTIHTGCLNHLSNVMLPAIGSYENRKGKRVSA